MKDTVLVYPVFISILLTVFPGILTLKDVEIILPRYVRQGLDVWLSCKYDLEKEALYAVKWYKGSEEFYRFLPKEVPPAKAFQLHGITVDVTLSNDRDVLLRNVSLAVSGTFRCVVAAEFPFQTLVASSDMSVVAIGEDSGPILKLDRSQYHPGDRVSAECRSTPSYPPANITWYLNDIMADRLNKTDILENRYDSMKSSALSKVSFDLPEKETPVGIKCRATIFSVYDKNSSITLINPVPRQLTGTETLLRSGTSVATHISSLPYLLYLIVVGTLASICNCSSRVSKER